MIVASIDIGSNTVLMLIAEINFNNNEFKGLKNFYRTPRIGQDIIKTGRIRDEKIASLFAVLSEYDGIIKKFGCGQIFVNATNALRVASNGEAIRSEIAERFGWNVNIIDGAEEARLSFLGSAFPFQDKENKIVIDIGGGSTEIVWGNRNSILYRKSFSIGVVSLKDLFVHNEPPRGEEILSMTGFAERTFSELKENIKDSCEIIAVAGTPTTLACIHQNLKEYSEEKIDGSAMNGTEISEITERLVTMRNSEIKESFGSVVEGREDVLLAGCIILNSAIKNIGTSQITVSTKGLRYGPVVEYLLNQ